MEEPKLLLPLELVEKILEMYGTDITYNDIFTNKIFITKYWAKTVLKAAVVRIKQTIVDNCKKIRDSSNGWFLTNVNYLAMIENFGISNDYNKTIETLQLVKNLFFCNLLLKQFIVNPHKFKINHKITTSFTELKSMVNVMDYFNSLIQKNLTYENFKILMKKMDCALTYIGSVSDHY